MIDQGMIEKTIVGKRIVAISWLPVSVPFGLGLESITLEDGTRLRLSMYVKSLREDIVVVEVEEAVKEIVRDANT